MVLFKFSATHHGPNIIAAAFYRFPKRNALMVVIGEKSRVVWLPTWVTL